MAGTSLGLIHMVLIYVRMPRGRETMLFGSDLSPKENNDLLFFTMPLIHYAPA
jgi:hypothetical protein